ncbi:hypothetical protein [Sulfurospirillum sp. MES]|uniref:hypothetical protein n=1 Tax=Sulfurospirillum sp. MES TaxID=1565314 RepID=UPI000543B901|nr:hypothetical protein [Sulfurospirillum sp. MES]KHG33991.1 MAG: hypothetical protein OA34_06485 [Sulfurospirillum sp. MES]
MNFLVTAKLLHIASAILFIGCVYFRNFILPQARLAFDSMQFEAMENALSTRTRLMGKINNTILLLSGLFLAYTYFEPINILLHVKMTFGLIVIAMFFGAPLIMHRFTGDKKRQIKTVYHHMMFALMVGIVILSQTMFSF